MLVGLLRAFGGLALLGQNLQGWESTSSVLVPFARAESVDCEPRLCTQVREPCHSKALDSTVYQTRGLLAEEDDSLPEVGA